jgi:hypothetical protein
MVNAYTPTTAPPAPASSDTVASVDNYWHKRVNSLEAEARQLREALLHRCAVNKIEDQCPECRTIIAVLDDTTATPEPAGAGDVERHVGGWVTRAEAEEIVLSMMDPPESAARAPEPPQAEEPTDA